MSLNKQMEEFPEEETLELENRFRNLLWTVSGDYSLEVKPDLALFRRSRDLALYEGIRQGAFAKYFDREALSLYLIKKLYLGAEEQPLKLLAALCTEEAVGERILQERPGIRSMRRQAFQDILDQEYEQLPSSGDSLGRLRVAMLSDKLSGETRVWEKALSAPMELLRQAQSAADTEELIAVLDRLYNCTVDPRFEERAGSLERVLAVTMEELCQDRWEDFLSEELYEEAMEALLQQMSGQVLQLENPEVTESMEQQRRQKHKIQVITEEQLEKAYTYVELNYGRTYLTELEHRRINAQCCRDLHSDCSLFFTEGILKNPVRRNYQYEYAKRLRARNLRYYKEQKRAAHRNIDVLTGLLKKSLLLRNESQWILSDRGQILPSRLWRVGRSSEARIFEREIRGDHADFAVDVLMDASGSQMERQEQVALQAFMISEALSNAGIPHRVMSYCTFWDYTILHRFREYEDPRSENENIFSYVTSSNNRDGLALRAAGTGLLERSEEKKILIVLSDGRPYDVIVNRPNARNPKPYQGNHAVTDTGAEVRRLRNAGVSVLGVFVGEEKDLGAEKKIFGKDFAYIRSIEDFSKIVGKYLMRLLGDENL